MTTIPGQVMVKETCPCGAKLTFASVSGEALMRLDEILANFRIGHKHEPRRRSIFDAKETNA